MAFVRGLLPERFQKQAGQREGDFMGKTTKRSSKTALARLTVYPAIPRESAKQAFVKSVQKAKDGQNSYLEDFLRVMDRITGSMASFSISDVLYCSQHLELPPDAVRSLFDRWTAKMLQFGRLEMVNGVYDHPVFLVR